MGLFDKNVKRSGQGLFSSGSSSFDNESIQRSINNAQTRIKDAGFKVEDADTRNAFERFTNLPQGQNWFFDTLELLGRPGNAIKNVINYGLQGRDDTGSAIYKGLSGQEKVSGADVAEKLGVTNKPLQFATGLALDIGTDPLTYVPGGVLAKGAKTTGAIAAKPVKAAYNALETAAPTVKTFRETRVEPALESTKDALGYMFKPGYKLDETLTGTTDDTISNLARSTENSRRYMQEEALKDVSDTARRAGGIETGEQVGRIMEAPLRQFEDVKAYEFPDGMTQTTSRKEIVKAASAKRQQIDELGRELKDAQVIQTNPLNLKQGDKAYKLSPEGKRLKGSKTLEIDEVRDVNGSREVRFKGDTTFVPINRVAPIGKTIQTDVGALNQEISQTIKELDKTDRELRRSYFSRENTELRNLTKKKNQPANINEAASSRAFEVVGASPKFNLLLKRRDELQQRVGELRGQVQSLKQDNVDAIQSLSDEVSALRTSAKNPITTQKEIARPEREMPTGPQIKQAAENLTKSNQAIRQFAEENGIKVPELEGYMTHVWSAEERARKKQLKPVSVDRGSTNVGNPSKGLMKNRQLPGSAEDVNEQIGRKFFEPNAYFATAIGQKRLIDYIHAVKFRKDVLSNPNFAVKYEKGMPIPKNAAVIDSNNYKFIKESDDVLEKSGVVDEIGGQYVVTKAAKQLLDRYTSINTDEGSKAFMKAFDTIQSFWKRAALFSPGYHIRNVAGAQFNNYIGGMNPADLAKYTIDASKEVKNALKGKESKLFEEYRKQGLSSSALSQVEFAKYGEEPEKAIERTVKERSMTTGQKVKTRLNPLRAFETSREVGDIADQANRLALYKWAREKKGMTPEQAAAKVREVQFDYSDLTPFESKLRRVIPFYAWMRNNIPFQIRQFINDPRKFEYVNKARINAQEAAGLEEENIPDYMKESFAIPVYSKGDGTGKMLGLNLPVADLTKLSSPGKTLLDAVTPLAKLPAELALNRNFFYNKPIEKFEGQEKQFVGGVGIPSKTAYALEQLTGQIGRGVSGYMAKPDQVDQDTKFRMPTFGITSILKEFDADKANNFQLREKLKELQDYMNYIEQQTGQKPRTIAEINKK